MGQYIATRGKLGCLDDEELTERKENYTHIASFKTVSEREIGSMVPKMWYVEDCRLVFTTVHCMCTCTSVHRLIYTPSYLRNVGNFARHVNAIMVARFGQDDCILAY